MDEIDIIDFVNDYLSTIKYVDYIIDNCCGCDEINSFISSVIDKYKNRVDITFYYSIDLSQYESLCAIQEIMYCYAKENEFIYIFNNIL